jgi:hypothetical protein
MIQLAMFLGSLAGRQLDSSVQRCTAVSRMQVAGGTDTVLECVLACDVERTQLLKEEAELLAAQKRDDLEASTSNTAAATSR